MPEALAPIKLGRDTARRSVTVATGILSAVGSLAAKAIGWTARRFRARPTSTAAGAAFAALMVGIGLNALVLQKARHPAPLFDAPVQDAQAPAAAPTPAPVAQSAAAQPAAPGDALDRAPTGTLPPGQEAAPPVAAADQPADVAQPAPAADPAARAATDDAPATKPAKKRHHGKSAAKKSKGHDKISQYLTDAKADRLHKRKPHSDD